MTSALAGGSTPRQAYQRLPALPVVPWVQVEIFFGDERAVPPESPDSNYRMAHQAFLSQVPIPAQKIHRMAAERDDQRVDLGAAQIVPVVGFELHLGPWVDAGEAERASVHVFG